MNDTVILWLECCKANIVMICIYRVENSPLWLDKYVGICFNRRWLIGIFEIQFKVGFIYFFLDQNFIQNYFFI